MQELDFSIEAANAERCRKNFSSRQTHVRGRVAVRPYLTPIIALLGTAHTPPFGHSYACLTRFLQPVECLSSTRHAGEIGAREAFKNLVSSRRLIE